MRRRIIAIGSTVILLAAMIFMLSFAAMQQHRRSVSDVKITIRYQGAEPLLTSSMILDCITNIYDTLNGRPVDAVDVEWIQTELEKISAVKSAGVQIRPDGSVEVRVKQRKPLLRVINAGQRQYYVTDDGIVIMNSQTLAAALPVLTGNIVEGIHSNQLDGVRCDTLSQKNVLKQAFLLGKAFEEHPFMNSLVEQVYRNQKGEFELVPLVGPNIILLGGLADLDSKFRRITLYYKQTYKHIDWSKYSIIDARFANQVVCIKKEQ